MIAEPKQRRGTSLLQMGVNFWWSTIGLRLRSWALLGLGVAMMLAVVLSGLSGHGWAAIGALCAAFAAARLLSRPRLITRLNSPGGPQRLALDLLGQCVVVLLLHGLGAGLSALTNWTPQLPLWLLTVAVLLSAALSRAIWRPMPPEWDSFLDEATEELNKMARDLASLQNTPSSDLPREDWPELREMSGALDGLPASGARHHDLVDAVSPAVGQVPLFDLTAAMFARARSARSERNLRALAILLSDPYVASQSIGQEDLLHAFELIVDCGSSQALATWQSQTLALLDFVPDAWRDLPQPDRLREIAQGLSDSRLGLAESLHQLAKRIEELTNEPTAQQLP